MRRFWVIAALAVAIVGLLLLAEDGGLKRLSTLGGIGERPQPSWGDVAGKVGEFSQEERDLQTAIEAASPPAETEQPQ